MILFHSFTNVKTILSSQTIHKEVAGQTQPAGHSLATPELDFRNLGNSMGILKRTFLGYDPWGWGRESKVSAYKNGGLENLFHLKAKWP